MKVKEIVDTSIPYLIAILSSLLCLLIGLLASLWIGKPNAFIVFLPAVMISTWYGGVRAGLLASVLDILAIYYFFIAPAYSWEMKSFVSIMQLLIFIFEATIISYFVDSGHRQEKISHFKKADKDNKKKILGLEEELRLARQEIALRDEFLSIASHELKTPLTTVVLQIQTTLHNIRNVSLADFSVEHLVHMLQGMQGQTKRLSKMINDLLNVSLITTHKLELELEDVDLTTLMKDMVEDHAAKFEKEGSKLSLDVKETIFGKWDKLRMEQVMDNLLSNAQKYGNKKPVRIELFKKDGFAIIRIIDHGIGIKSTDKEKIFSLFKRGVSEKDYKGLGIGLYIVKQIVELHGGTITVESASGNGTTFTVSLPIVKAK